jgi:hypothetical protein
MVFGGLLFFVGVYYLIRKKIAERKHKKDLLLKIKSKGKDKIRKMNDEEQGYELDMN